MDFWFVFLMKKKKTDFATDFENLQALPMTKKGETYVEVKIHSKIRDQNPRRAPAETCCPITGTEITQISCKNYGAQQ